MQPVRVVSAGRRGFTLLEILVALGAVVVVAVGLATIFRSVGDTVSAGRRLSRINQVSKLLEQQLRADFESMTRDGFLVIRQQYADRDADGILRRTGASADTIPLFADQEADRQRLRRVDEVLFFRKGTFRSQRAPLGDESWRTASNEAMLYYGHGQRRREDDTDNVVEPKLNDLNHQGAQADDVRLGNQTPGNPNAVASSWSLLRNVTLLVPPSTSEGVLPTGAIYDIAANEVNVKADKECQIAGQPAAASIFRGINRGAGPETPSNDFPFGSLREYVWLSDNAQIGRNYQQALGPDFSASPSLASGLVDVATTSLAEIRSQVLGYADLRTQAVGLQPIALMPGEVAPDFLPPTSSFSFSLVADATQVQPARPNPYESLDYMHGWMSNAFPGRAAAQSGSEQFSLDDVGLSQDDVPGTRPRYTPTAERLYDLLALAPNSPAESRSLANLLADRRMLQSSILLSNCTEFIVEWSFGESDPDGSYTGVEGTTLWYGPRERTGNNVLPRDGVMGYYLYNNNPGEVGYVGTNVLQRDGQFTNRHHPVSPRLIYGHEVSDEDGQAIGATSYFGYVDPTFDADQTGDGDANDDGDAASTTLPWRWPSLLRVRVTIADPIDPSIETSFEYVFAVPAK